MTPANWIAIAAILTPILIGGLVFINHVSSAIRASTVAMTNLTSDIQEIKIDNKEQNRRLGRVERGLVKVQTRIGCTPERDPNRDPDSDS